MNKFKKFRTISSIAIASGFALVLGGGLLAGCGTQEQVSELKGAFVVLEEDANGGYTVIEESPANETRVILRQKDGSERMLSQAEIDKFLQEENAKIDAGTSRLTNEAQLSGGGMSIGEAILASAAGAIIGSWIGGKLFNNQGYQQARAHAYKSPSAYTRSVSNFQQAQKSAGTKKGGFFNKAKTGSSVGA